MIDAISVTLAGSLVVWILFVRPELQELGLSTVARVAAVGTWVGYIAVFTASVRVILCWRGNISVGLLGCAVAGLVLHADGGSFNRDAALAFQVHRIKYLGGHVAR